MRSEQQVLCEPRGTGQLLHLTVPPRQEGAGSSRLAEAPRFLRPTAGESLRPTWLSRPPLWAPSGRRGAGCQGRHRLLGAGWAPQAEPQSLGGRWRPGPSCLSQAVSTTDDLNGNCVRGALSRVHTRGGPGAAARPPWGDPRTTGWRSDQRPCRPHCHRDPCPAAVDTALPTLEWAQGWAVSRQLHSVCSLAASGLHSHGCCDARPRTWSSQSPSDLQLAGHEPRSPSQATTPGLSPRLETPGESPLPASQAAPSPVGQTGGRQFQGSTQPGCDAQILANTIPDVAVKVGQPARPARDPSPHWVTAGRPTTL